MPKFLVEVEKGYEITIDENVFTPDFMAQFAEVFYPFTTLQEHAEHLACCLARGMLPSEIEGYNFDTMGIVVTGLGPATAFAEETE